MDRLLVQWLVAATVLLAVAPVLPVVPRKEINVPPFGDIPEKFSAIVVTVHGPYYPLYDTEQLLQLTQNGKEVMQDLGEALVKRYKVLFQRLGEMQKDIDQHWTGEPNEKPRVFQVTAINKEIAKASAKEIITGIQRMGKEFNLNMDIALSGENIDSNDFFNPLLLNKQKNGKCKVFDNIIEHLKVNVNSKKPDTAKEDEEGEDENTFLKYDRLQMKFLKSREPKTSEEDLTIMREIANRRMKRLIGDDIKYWKFFVSPMLINIFKELKIPMTLVQTDSQERESRLHIHVVDVHLMAALVWWLSQEGQLSEVFMKGKPHFYPQVGDSLTINVDDEMNFQIDYITAVESVETADDRVVYAPMDLKPKAEQDFGIKTLTTKGIAWFWFNCYLFRDEKDWQKCCESSECGP